MWAAKKLGLVSSRKRTTLSTFRWSMLDQNKLTAATAQNEIIDTTRRLISIGFILPETIAHPIKPKVAAKNRRVKSTGKPAIPASSCIVRRTGKARSSLQSRSDLQSLGKVVEIAGFHPDGRDGLAAMRPCDFRPSRSSARLSYAPTWKKSIGRRPVVAQPNQIGDRRISIDCRFISSHSRSQRRA